jgi:hypothetical protein
MKPQRVGMALCSARARIWAKARYLEEYEIAGQAGLDFLRRRHRAESRE